MLQELEANSYSIRVYTKELQQDQSCTPRQGLRCKKVSDALDR